MGLLQKYIVESFDNKDVQEYFLSETKLSKLVNHAKKHHKILSTYGSSRIVFELDEQRVIKIAKNTKGLAQNSNESMIWNDGLYNEIVCPILQEDQADEPKWLIVRKASKAKQSDFLTHYNISFKEFVIAVDYLASTVGQERKGYDLDEAKAIFRRDEVFNDEEHLLHKIHNLMGNYGLMGGDITKISSWGIVDNELVLIDYGFTESTFKQHYKK
jgi:hypothetical protein